MPYIIISTNKNESPVIKLKACIKNFLHEKNNITSRSKLKNKISTAN